jgi:hypothetical protein
VAVTLSRAKLHCAAPSFSYTYLNSVPTGTQTPVAELIACYLADRLSHLIIISLHLILRYCSYKSCKFSAVAVQLTYLRLQMMNSLQPAIEANDKLICKFHDAGCCITHIFLHIIPRVVAQPRHTTPRVVAQPGHTTPQVVARPRHTTPRVVAHPRHTTAGSCLN